MSCIHYLVLAIGLIASCLTASPQHGDPVNMLARIREEGLLRSRTMDYASELIDGIGPRLTASPNLKRELAWSQDSLRKAGLDGVRAESWGLFGLSWRERNAWARITVPDTAPIIMRAAPWSPSTKGIKEATVVKVRGFRSPEEFAVQQGRLRGKIVLYGSAPSLPEVVPIEKPLFRRLSKEQLDDWAAQPYEKSTGYGEAATSLQARSDLVERVGRFFAAEGVVAVLVPSGNNTSGGRSGGTISVDTNNTFGWFVYQRQRAMSVPLAVLALEHYGRMERLLDRRVPVRVELNIDTETAPKEEEGFNVFAEIAGAEPSFANQLVIVAAHLDSWSTGNGATDDGAGVIIAMEAMRVLRAVGARPRRTIRLALWSGEEQGSLGSRAWAKRHVGDVPLAASRLPEFLRAQAGPVKPKGNHALISAVYTLDAGGGRVRGVSTGNPALDPVSARADRPPLPSISDRAARAESIVKIDIIGSS